MYAVIASGGKQYRVTEGQVIKLEKIDTDKGDQFEFEKVLMIVDGENVSLGAPFLDAVKVKAEVIKHGRGDKIHVLKFRRRKHHMKQMGHRQDYTEVKIIGIETTKKSTRKSSEKKGSEE